METRRHTFDLLELHPLYQGATEEKIELLESALDFFGVLFSERLAMLTKIPVQWENQSGGWKFKIAKDGQMSWKL